MIGTPTGMRIDAAMRAACEDLVLEEATRLDAREYAAWLELFTEDAEYWVPLREGQPDPHAELNIIYDDRSRMEDRVFRLLGGSDHSQDPPSRTVRNIAGFRCEQTEDGDVIVRSTVVIIEVRVGRQQVFGGRYIHRLRGVPENLRIASKTVVLVNSEEPFGNLTFLL